MKKVRYVIFTNNNGDIISKEKINDLKVDEIELIKISKREYGTDEPCIMYRTCIYNDFIEKVQRLVTKSVNNCFNVKEIKQQIPELYAEENWERIIFISE